MYFGLQTGYGNTMAVPSALLGFALFRLMHNYLNAPFTPGENVLVQTVAGAVGIMPISSGFIGIIPALKYLLRPSENGPLHLSWFQLVAWSLGRQAFGAIFSVAFRAHFIYCEKLPFPSATATARVIKLAHSHPSVAKSPLPNNEVLISPVEGPGDIPNQGAGNFSLNSFVETWNTIWTFLVLSAASGSFVCL
jgi:uncharacterized oligopeptide transporter (OPT) family protein